MWALAEVLMPEESSLYSPHLKLSSLYSPHLKL
jgi:hypothetical protein